MKSSEQSNFIGLSAFPHVGGRRGRGGRGRANVLPPSEGPSLADLASSGISVDILQKLVPRCVISCSVKESIHEYKRVFNIIPSLSLLGWRPGNEV